MPRSLLQILFHTLFVTLLVFAGICAYSQQPKRQLDETIAAPSRIPGRSNLDEAIKRSPSYVEKESLPNNQPPSDLKPQAKELEESGWSLFYEKNKPEMGIKKIEQALQIDPRIPRAYNTLMLYYGLAKKDPSTARRFLQDGVKACPKSGSVHFDLGNVYSLLKEHAKAIDEFQTAIRLGTEVKASAFDNIGLAYGRMGDKTNAVLFHRKAVAEDPRHFNGRQNLVSALVHAGDLKAARSEAEALQTLDPLGKHGRWAREALKHLPQR